MKLTKTQSYDNILRDVEANMEKDISDYLDDMTEDDREKLVKASKKLSFDVWIIGSSELASIAKPANHWLLSFIEPMYNVANVGFTIDELKLQDKRTLLKLIEEII